MGSTWVRTFVAIGEFHLCLLVAEEVSYLEDIRKLGYIILSKVTLLKRLVLVRFRSMLIVVARIITVKSSFATEPYVGITFMLALD